MSLPGAAGKGGSASGFERPAIGHRFPRTHRLTTRREYLAVYAGGRRASSGSFVLFGLANELNHSRLGLTVTRKTGGAVRRNRAKRLLREIFRRNRTRLQPSLDLVVNARPSIVERSYADLESEFLHGFARLVRGMSR